MNRVSRVFVSAFCSILLSACGAAEFSGSTDSQSKTAAELGAAGNEAGGVLGQNPNDETCGVLPSMTADEVTGVIEDALAGAEETPAALEQILENELKPLRCYISGGGGHGMDMCMADTSGVQKLSARGARGTFIEIKGSQLCVPLKVFLDNKALFAKAVTGECQSN